MSSPQGVRVELDKPRTLRFTNRALVRLEIETGENVFWHLTRSLSGSIRSRVLLVWAASLHANDELDSDAVIDWIDLTKQRELSEALAELVNETFGTNGDAEGKVEAAAES